MVFWHGSAMSGGHSGPFATPYGDDSNVIVTAFSGERDIGA